MPRASASNRSDGAIRRMTRFSGPVLAPTADKGRNAAVLINRNHATAVAATLRATPQSQACSLHNAVCWNIVNLLCDAAHSSARAGTPPNRKGPVPGALLIVGDAARLAVPVVAAVMPAWAKAEGHFRAIVVVVVATITRIVVAATIVRARRAYTNAHAAWAGVKADLRHCRRGGEDARCRNKTKCNLFHDGSPLGTWLGKRARRNVVPAPATRWSQVPCKNYRTNFAELWNQTFWNKKFCKKFCNTCA